MTETGIIKDEAAPRTGELTHKVYAHRVSGA